MSEISTPELSKGPGIKGYFALLLVILFFSGWMNGHSILGFLDFNTLLGKYGQVAQGIIFTGKGGTGARGGFIFALSLIPAIMFALSVVQVADYFGALKASQQLLTPFLRPVLGLPGISGLALISSLQSSDAGGAMTRELFESGRITDYERSIFGAFQFSAGATIGVYMSVGVALFPHMSVSILVPLGVIFFCKIVGTNLMRLYVEIVLKKKGA